MIQSYLLTSTVRLIAPKSFVLSGDVRLGAWEIGGVATGGRAP